jgi:hypothetical protein
MTYRRSACKHWIGLVQGTRYLWAGFWLDDVLHCIKRFNEGLRFYLEEYICPRRLSLFIFKCRTSKMNAVLP